MTSALIKPNLAQATSAAQLKADLIARGVRYALPSFVDLHGVCKAKAGPIDHLESMARGSELFTGAALDGVPQKISDDEVAALPDLSSATVLPWKPDTVWFASSPQLEGSPFDACSRTILSRVQDQAAALGLRFNLGIETEFFALRRDENGELMPASAGDTLAKPCCDLRGLLDNFDWMDELVQAMNGLGWGVYSFDHEDGNGQFETDFGYADGLVTADRVTFFRLMAREICRNHGLIASLMPKPFANRTNMLRIPGAGSRVECRAADSACNPYLAAAMLLAAGLEGISEGLDPGEPNLVNAYQLSEEELSKRGITTLPRTFSEAIEAFAADPLSRQVFGDAMASAYVAFKRDEWSSYHGAISDWETKRYLELF
jgi:glutamine synthetase